MSSTAAAPLVGRDTELRMLDEVLDGLWAGGSPALVVTGEPGIGKTRVQWADPASVDVITNHSVALLVDLGGTTYIDSAGINVILQSRPRAASARAAAASHRPRRLARRPDA